MPERILTAEETAEARKRADAATPGPWEVRTGGSVFAPHIRLTAGIKVIAYREESYPESPDEFAFIAASRADVPALCDTVDALREADRRLRKRIHLSEGHNQIFERCESTWCCPERYGVTIPESVAELYSLEDTARRIGEAEDAATALRSENARLKADALTVQHLRGTLARVKESGGAGSDLSDSEIAGRVRMLGRQQLDHELVCLMGRDRIIALSDEVTRLTERCRELEHERDGDKELLLKCAEDLTRGANTIVAALELVRGMEHARSCATFSSPVRKSGPCNCIVSKLLEVLGG